jgi:rubrerythrin
MNNQQRETSKKCSTAPVRDAISRRSLLATLGGGAIGAASGLSILSSTSFGQEKPKGKGTEKTPSDFDILNFALNLEYLESEFYTYAVTGQGIDALGISGDGVGTKGETTNGQKLEFTDQVLFATAKELAFDEQQHVKLLRSLLGKKAVAKPAINLAALGIGFGSEAEYLTVGRAMEDTGVSAYGGAAPLLKSKEILGIAARILADEAYHMGNVRLFIAQKGVQVKPTDDKDILPPPAGTKFFCVDDRALSLIRTPEEVLRIARPFFPNGLNGTIK